MKIKGNSKRFNKIRLAGKPHDEVDFKMLTSQDGLSADIYIYDVIGWPYVEAADLLYQLTDRIETISVFINSPGGDIQEGMAIYNLLKVHPATVNIFVDGFALSCGSLIAMAGDKITMRELSFMMIHSGWSTMSGDPDELRAEADILEKMNEMFAGVYAARSGKNKEEVLKLMKAETWFTPAEAVENGFADEIEKTNSDNQSGMAAGVDRFDLSIFENAPTDIKRAAIARKSKHKKNKPQEDSEMKKELKALLERLGLKKDATEAEAWEFCAGVDVDKLIKDEAEKQMIKTGLDNQTSPPIFTKADLEAAAKEAAGDERTRVAAIEEMSTIAGLDAAFFNKLVKDEATVNEARQAVFEEMKKNKPVAPGAYLQADEKDKFRAAAVDGFGARFGLKPDKPAPGHEQFRAASLDYMARICLERAGVDTRQFSTRGKIADEVFRHAEATGAYSTDDFTSIFLDVSNKVLMKAYMDAPSTWRPFVNVVPAADFKTIYGVSLSEAPSLDLIGENGEYKPGSMSDNQESYSVASYGKIIYLTRKMIINDDSRAFGRMPQLFGSAARRKESDLVYAKITSNPTMNDGNALFSSAHSNLEATTANKGVCSADNLAPARTAMRKQMGPKLEAYLDLNPAFVLAPVAQETNLDIILRSTGSTVDEKNSGVVNPWNGKLTAITDPRLDADSALAWYLIADPAQADTIEVAFLDGNEMPYLEERALFERDAIGLKVRHDIGVGLMEYRSMFKNPGA